LFLTESRAFTGIFAMFLPVFETVLENIRGIFQEYYFTKVASVFSKHFAKPLIMDYAIELSSSSDSDSYLFIETIYEHEGESLNKVELTNISEIYNLMQQSADALSILHEASITYFGIKPAHMVYNRSKDVLKVIDMDNSYEYSMVSELQNNMKIKFIFCPPEVLQLKKGTVKNKELILGTVDVYCWAISFYSLLLKKAQGDLRKKADKFNLNNESTYSKFLDEVETELKNIKVNQDQEQKKLEVITEELIKALSYNPEKRPMMKDIAEKMKINSKLIINAKENNDNPKKTINKPMVVKDDKICKDCLNKDKKKVTLECGHYMCEKCISKYVFEKFGKKEEYDHKVICSRCKKIKKIGILHNYIK
jgi:serine/threonine protein kinase